MTKRLNVLPYKMASASATALADELGVAKIRLSTACRYNHTANKLVINWGNAGSVQHTRVNESRILNTFSAVNIAGNKLLAFRALQGAGVSIPEFTTDPIEADNWLREGINVIERHVLRGHSAEGIVLLDSGDSVLVADPNCPLFTKYMRKTQEYRVHVVQGVVTDVQRKARRIETPDDQINWQIRNHDNGFIYAREFAMNAERQEALKLVSLAAIEALGLDFGAVDLMYHRDTGFTVLEVNTAVGLEGTTLSLYANAFQHIANDNPPDGWILTQTTEQTTQSTQSTETTGTNTMSTSTAPTIPTSTPVQPFALGVNAAVLLSPSVENNRNNPALPAVVVGERGSGEVLKFLVKFSNDVLNTYSADQLIQNTNVDAEPVQTGHRKPVGSELPDTDFNGNPLYVGDTVSFVRNDENDIYVEYFGLGTSAVIAGWDINGTVVLENTVVREGRTFGLDNEMPFGIAWYRIVGGTESISGAIPEEHNQPLPPVRFVELGEAGGPTYDTGAEYPNDRILITAQLEEVAPIIFKLESMRYTVLADDAAELLEELTDDLGITQHASGQLVVDGTHYKFDTGVSTALKQEITNVAISVVHG